MTFSVKQHQRLLTVGAVAHASVFCFGFTLLLDGWVSDFVDGLVVMVDSFLKPEAMEQLENHKERTIYHIHQAITMLTSLCALQFSFSILALAHLSYGSTSWLLLPHILARGLNLLGFLTLAFLLVAASIFSPGVLTIPLMAAFCCLLLLLRLLLLDMLHLASMMNLVQGEGRGLNVWSNLVADLENDRVFLVSQPKL